VRETHADAGDPATHADVSVSFFWGVQGVCAGGGVFCVGGGLWMFVRKGKGRRGDDPVCWAEKEGGGVAAVLEAVPY
jgi:hypothetical protein